MKNIGKYSKDTFREYFIETLGYEFSIDTFREYSIGTFWEYSIETCIWI